MPSVEWISVVRHAALLDHTHTREHVMVLLDGEMHEDGRVFTPGDVRVSTAEDRHFLRFVRPSRCLLVEGAAPALLAGRRRVLSLPGLLSELRDTTGKEEAVAFAAGDRLADAIDASAPPSWLVEFERCLTDGGFGRAGNVDVMARKAGVSREHLSRTYRRHFGTSVSMAVRAHRMREAYHSVTHSTLPLVDVAGACGFSDQSHMTRHFAAWIGLTPGALRSGCDITSVQDALTCTCM